MIIHLGDETRAEVIDSVLGQLSDGIWENSGAMNKYWMFADVEGTDLVIDDEPFRDEQGWGRYGSTLKRIQNGFAGKSEKQIKDWFANKAKQVVKIWAEDEGKDPKYIWNRANDDDIVDYMGGHKVRTITVADVYECYDFLKGRSGKKYGIAADPLPYEVECSTRRTISKYSQYVKGSSDTSRLLRTYYGISDCLGDSGSYLYIYINKAEKANDEEKLRQYAAAINQLKDVVDSALEVFDAQIDGISEGQYIEIRED